MFGRGIFEKYQSRDDKFPEPNGEGNLVSKLVFFANTPPKHDISIFKTHLHEVKILQIHNARPEFVKNITAINQSESSILI
jgi:hypothetical protein